MTTPLDALIDALRAAAVHNPAAEAAPEAVVWCDPSNDFAPIFPALRARLPHLLTHGEHDPSNRTGPALWLRAAAVRRVPGVDWPPSDPPVIYLPGHGREVLRGAEDCPAELAPLVWFGVAGTFFGQQRQARDWTLRGFLTAQGSPVSLEIAEDKMTREALARAASRIFAEPISALRGKRWTAAELDALLVPDPAADMLAWLDGVLTPEADTARFEAFAALVTRQLSFDPRKKHRQDAAARLAHREKGWAKVWDRFEQANGAYEGVVKLLRAEEPQSMIEGLDAYPSVNARAETELRAGLRALASAAPEKARQFILDLERTHGWRRGTVWAKRGEARLTEALAHLAIVAGAAPLPAHDAEGMANAYAADGWRVDAAALAALDLVRNGEDRDAVVRALRATYLPWLDAGASALQALALSGSLPFARPEATPPPLPGNVILFVDGLRMDLARRLVGLLEGGGATVQANWRWSGFPSVTATCKPLASPAAGLLSAGPVDGLSPTFEGKSTSKPVLTKAIEAAGWTCGTNLLPEAALWVEGRSIDRAGEDNGADLVLLARDILADIAEVALRHARDGRRVRIVTDHGFLLMPQGLPHAELTPGLAEPTGKARRVVLLKDGATTGYPRLPWSWDGSVLMATATGARAFYNGVEYAHGGVSVQECVLPVLDVSTDGSVARVALTARWRGLMLKVRADGGAGLVADLRLGADTSGESALVTGPKTLDDAGEANLGVAMDFEGQTVCVVLYRTEAPADVIAKLVMKAEG